MQKKNKKVRLSKKKTWQIYLKTLKKQTRGRYSYTATKNNNLSSGFFGIKSLSAGRIYTKHIDAMSRFLTKRIKKKIGFIRKHVTFNRTLTKKSTGIRMGKGKGDIKEITSNVDKGNLLFEVNLFRKEYFESVLNYIKSACKRSPFPVEVITNRHLQHINMNSYIYYT